jgi:hypothetical protein
MLSKEETKFFQFQESTKMKKLILLLSFVVSSFVSFSQNDESTIYKVFKTEFYIYNEDSEKWVIQSKNDVDITMVSYKNVINIQAKTPTLYRIDKLSEKSIGGGDKDYYGVRVNALECVDMKKCVIDLSDPTSKTFVLSVIFDNETLGKINLRYYSFLE